ncbi:unnamed protein product [Adineta steineri]|uniref:Uncharacterized protein n=1 Tax=Adineta steineri TaxID=433720 RepID=A0A813YBI8_9BILA|nr:unnamed protein product [Adineta steineri]CAF0884287.1 unnamed protein product [Adineta steineri]CAF0887757.1 unnamed protein product [Adineta steineri]
MEWTYSVYMGVTYGISCTLFVVISTGVAFIYSCSKTGKEFINKRVIGVDPPDVEDDENDDVKKKRMKIKEDVPSENKSDDDHDTNGNKLIGGLFCILAVMTLSIAAALIFEGCFLANARLLPDDNCPDYPMDCFVFNQIADPQPITQSASFRCLPTNKTQFPSGASNGIAVCFGWIIKLQTTKNILDQFGICTGLIGLFTTLLAIIIYLGKSIKTIVLSCIFIVASIVTIILLAVFKWSFAPLTYAVLVLGMTLGIFGVCLYFILPKPIDKNTNQPTPEPNKSPIDSPPHTVVPVSMSYTPKTTAAYRNKVAERQSKVFPESTSPSNIKQ